MKGYATDLERADRYSCMSAVKVLVESSASLQLQNILIWRKGPNPGKCRVKMRHYGLGAAMQRLLQPRNLRQRDADIRPQGRYPGLLGQRYLGPFLFFYVRTGSAPFRDLPSIGMEKLGPDEMPAPRTVTCAKQPKFDLIKLASVEGVLPVVDS